MFGVRGGGKGLVLGRTGVGVGAGAGKDLWACRTAIESAVVCSRRASSKMSYGGVFFLRGQFSACCSVEILKDESLGLLV